ncbi:MAG: hypothetical protein HY075_10100, partial [Deltaproteobacteria bacterium]|nr:hypothetical protein [Deltaproteobacteria bacterium]
MFTALLALAALSGAHASLEDFCDRPYEAICGEDDEAETERDRKVEQIKQRISRKAHEAAGPNAPLKRYYQELMAALRAELGEAHKAPAFHFERIRARLVPAVKTLRHVSADEADDMLANLARVKFIDALQLLSSPAKDEEQLAATVRKDCGDDGMIDNAFAFDHEGELYVVVCPGAAVAALGPDDRTLKSTELALAGVVWLLGHETGHHIDASDHPVMYDKLKACLADNYASELKSRDLDGYMSEISADYWGTEELAA